jgi:hypothetical protein
MAETNTSSALQGALLIDNDQEFLDAIVDVGPPLRRATAGEFAELPRLRQNLILTRALWMKLQVGDIRDLLEETVCGGYITQLQVFLGSINAQHAASFLKDVESMFPGGAVPVDEERRHSLLMDFEMRRPKVLAGLTRTFLQHQEDFVAVLRKHLRENFDAIAEELSRSR